MAPGRIDAVVQFLHRRTEGGEHSSDSQLLDRFIRHRDAEAFALLVRRHGPMVLGVCRRRLRHRQDAEDAFQATFLLLIRKAARLRQPECLGPWLYGVASRTAQKAYTVAQRRRTHQLKVEWPAAESADEFLWRDVRPILDTAIGELPGRYRDPVILCYLQGLTYTEAARRLGCPANTVATRLARARDRLRGRLARHGLALSIGLVTTLLSRETLSASVPTNLLGAVSRLVEGKAPAPIVALAKGVGNAMLMDRIRSTVIGLTLVGLAGLGIGWSVFRGEAAEPPPAVPLPPIALQASPPPSSAETANFRVNAANERIADLVAREAERQRKEQAIRWLGKELPPWDKPCPIEVKISTGGSGSATSFQFADGRVKEQNMSLQGSLEQVLSSLTAHEVTHAVWASEFGKPVPRWADEGAAMLSEDGEDQKRTGESMLTLLDKPDRLIPLRRLFAMTEYPQDVMVLYTEGFMVTRFLVNRKDRPTFLRFVKDGMKDGWDKAVKGYYGFKDVEELEDAWLSPLKEIHARCNDKKAEEVKQEPLSSGQPVPALAALSADGSFVRLRLPMTYYEPVTATQMHSGAGSPPPPRTFYRQVTRESIFVLPIDQITVFALNGDKVEQGQLAKALPQTAAADKGLAVLVALDGKKVDPIYLRVVKEGTLILTPPAGHLQELNRP